ncbi:MAG: PAS domain-containing protein, partial [Desulfosarcinaceae bacterium]
MSSQFKTSKTYQTLRSKAEQVVRNQHLDVPEADRYDLMRLAHELEVQQVELEMQNEELRRAGRELEASRNEFADLFDNAPLAFLAVDEQGRIERANQAAGRLLAGPDRFLIGRRFQEFVLQGDMGLYYELLNGIASGSGARFCELRLR